jgi:hypothetical protein
MNRMGEEEEMTKKIVLVVVLATIGAGGLFALNWQEFPDPIKGGSLLISPGIGFGTPLHGNMVIPPITVTVDYALPVGLPFTLGALGGLTTSEYKGEVAGVHTHTYDYTGIAIAGRFGYHPDLGVKNLNISANIALGYYLYSAKATYAGTYKPDPDDFSRLYLGFNLGARYFFTKNVGAFLEFGYSAMSFVTAGMTFKI